MNMTIQKAFFNSEDNKLRLSMPISKINEEKRTISGFATLDNVDQHNDVIPADASLRAFAEWRGNMREMHAPVAVGKAISFKEQDFVDPDTQQSYKGIYLEAYISKGAENTWQKVLDGTLTGFSIGGNIKKFDSAVRDSKQIRIIKDYALDEISLVDVPANQFSKLLSIQKLSDGSVHAEGILVEKSVENVYHCSTDNIAISSQEQSHQCAACGEEMSNIGTVESNDENKTQKILDMMKGGSDVANENDVVDEVVVEDEKVDDVKADEVVEAEVDAEPDPVVEDSSKETEASEKVEKAAEVEEVETEDLSTKLDKIASSINSAVSELRTSQETEVLKVTKSVEATATELNEKIDTLSKALEEVKGNVDTVNVRVDAVESDTAIKKSLKKAAVAEKTESIWGGSFIGADAL